VNDVVRVVEAAYDLDAPDEGRWLSGLAEAARDELGFSGGVLGYVYQVGQNGWVTPRTFHAPGELGPLAMDLLGVGTLAPELQTRMARLHRTIGVTLAMSVPGDELHKTPMVQAWRAKALDARNIADAVCVTATDPTRHGCMLFAPVRAVPALGGRVVARYEKLATHISAGLRLRNALSSSPQRLPGEAVLDPGGRVEHATGEATPATARTKLRDAVRSLERARGKLRRSDPDEALAIWRGLVAGRWTLVDTHESDGRRFIVAHKNDPDAPDPRALTLRERQVVGFVALGLSNKAIAYELGISASTVAVLLARAAKKLGTKSREGLVGSLERRDDSV
jgi:DNA-binding CsgD family transcriptional regulator